MDEQPRQSRTLVVAHRYEPSYLAPKILGSNSPLTTTRLFNAASENLPGYPLYFSIHVRTRVASLQGSDDEAQTPGFGQVSKATTAYWNVQDWTFR